MASVSTYLNFERNTEEAFKFYKSVFGGEFNGGKIMRYGDIPDMPGSPPVAEQDEYCNFSFKHNSCFDGSHGLYSRNVGFAASARPECNANIFYFVVWLPSCCPSFSYSTSFGSQSSTLFPSASRICTNFP